MEYFIVLMLGCVYGFFVGLIPVAGATTGLILIYSFVGYFDDPYMLVVFTTAYANQQKYIQRLEQVSHS
jgi:TctA family transporter